MDFWLAEEGWGMMLWMSFHFTTFYKKHEQ